MVIIDSMLRWNDRLAGAEGEEVGSGGLLAAGPGGAEMQADAEEMMLDHWLETVIAATESFASLQLEALAPFFFRLAVRVLFLRVSVGVSSRCSDLYGIFSGELLRAISV
jgi:hypothetical protein